MKRKKDHDDEEEGEENRRTKKAPSEEEEKGEQSEEFGGDPPPIGQIVLASNSSKTTQKRRLFCGDVISESLQFLSVTDLLLLAETNRRVLARPCRFSLDRLTPPRTVGPLYINNNLIHRDRGNDTDGRRILEALPFPLIPPPSDKILGFGPITIDLWALLRPGNGPQLMSVCKFLSLCGTLLGKHELLLKRETVWTNADRDFLERFAVTILSRLPSGGDGGGAIRAIRELDIWWWDAAVLRSEAFLGARRLLFTNPLRKNMDWLGHSHFEGCVDWLHFPTPSDGGLRTLIFCTRSPEIDYVDPFIQMIVKRFECSPAKNKDAGPPPRFCVIVLFPGGGQLSDLAPFHRINKERGDALSLEPICHGCDRFGRPISELVSVELERNGPDPPLTEFFSHCFHWAMRYPYIQLFPSLGGYILRRDVAVGPWTRPVLIEAQRLRANRREEEKVLHLIWS